MILVKEPFFCLTSLNLSVINLLFDGGDIH